MSIRNIKSILKQQSKLFAGIAIGGLVAGIGSAVAFAAVPAANGAVSICYRTGGLLPSGQARVIDKATQSCNGTETEIAVGKAAPGNFLTSLGSADFSGADLRYRNFVGVNLQNANLSNANLKGSDMQNANLSAATLGSDVRNVNFQDATLDSASITGYIEHTNFIGATLNSANIESATFESNNLSGLEFNTVNFLNTISFYNNNLQNTEFNNLHLANVSMQNNNVTGANFTNVQFEDSNLQGNNLSVAILTGATWINTICPDGTNSDNNGNTCVGHLVP